MHIRYKPNSTGLRRRPVARRWLLALAWCCAAIAVPLLAGDGDVRPQDHIWLASTRHVGCVNLQSEPALWQRDAGQWVASDKQAFLQQNEKLPHTVVYIHGNRVGDDEGVGGGLAVYQQIVARHAGENPVRFVIWSWPSTKTCGPIRDVRSKAWRSDDEAVMLAQFLDGINNKADRVGFVAFSYGARITGGALQLLGGGEFDGMTIPQRQRPQFHVAFWAAGTHNDWLLPHGRLGEAMPLADKWFSTVNSCDESLWRYERLEKCGNPPALGFVGFSGRGQLSPELQSRWEEWDVSKIVGSTHNYHPYVHSDWIAEQTAKCVLWK